MTKPLLRSPGTYIIPDNLEPRERIALEDGPMGYDGEVLRSGTLALFANETWQTPAFYEKYDLADLWIHETMPMEDRRAERAYEKWRRSYFDPNEAPWVWLGSNWRPPEKIAAAARRLADLVEQRVPPTAEMIDRMIWGAEYSHTSAQECDERREEFRQGVADYWRSIANYCEELARRGATKLTMVTVD